MKESDDLFQLIKSLTKNEKRYFKIHSSLHTIGEHNKYLDLFDAIDNQKEHDEKKIRNLFSNERFIKQLPVAKNYLYQLILRSLEQYHNTINSTLRSYLNQSEILRERFLYKQSEKILVKARQLAEQYEKYTVLLEIFALENRVLVRQSFSTKTKEQVEDSIKKELSTIEKQQNLIEYRNLIDIIYIHYAKEGLVRTPSDLTYYKNIMKHPLFSSEDKALSFVSKRLFYHAKAQYYQNNYFNRLKNSAKAYFYAKKIVQLYESNPPFMEEDVAGYYNSYQTLIVSAVTLKKHNEVHAYIETLNTIATKSNYLEYRNFHFTNNVLMVLAINTGQFKKGVELISGIQKEIQKKGFENIHIEDHTTFYQCYAVIYFCAKQYSKAIIFLNKIINSPLNNRNDLYCFAKFMTILVHYELGNESLLESAIRSTYRYLYKRKKIQKFEAIVMEFIRKELPQINSSKDRIEAFKKLKKEIIKISKDPYERKSVENFDIISWLDSKILNRPLTGLMKEKAMQSKN